MSSLSIPHQPKLLVENRPNATENRPNATILCHLRALLCHLGAILCHSMHDANSGLRRIVCDFLTAGNRVGGNIRLAAPRRLCAAKRGAHTHLKIALWSDTSCHALRSEDYASRRNGESKNILDATFRRPVLSLIVSCGNWDKLQFGERGIPGGANEV